jgi:hypothetical protein
LTYLDDLSVDGPGGISVQPIREISGERIKFLSNGHGCLVISASNSFHVVLAAHVRRLVGEKDDLVELRQVSQKVVDSRSLCGPPSLYSLHDQLVSDDSN